MRLDADDFGADNVRVGHTYGICLAPGIVTTATIVFERITANGRFVRFVSPQLKQPGYCNAERFAEQVRSAAGR